MEGELRCGLAEHTLVFLVRRGCQRSGADLGREGCVLGNDFLADRIILTVQNQIPDLASFLPVFLIHPVIRAPNSRIYYDSLVSLTAESFLPANSIGSVFRIHPELRDLSPPPSLQSWTGHRWLSPGLPTVALALSLVSRAILLKQN